MDVLTLLNARVDGKQVLLSAPGAAHAVHILSHLATRGVDEIKDRALVALAHIFRYKLKIFYLKFLVRIISMFG